MASLRRFNPTVLPWCNCDENEVRLIYTAASSSGFLIALIFGADILHELSAYSSNVAALFYHCFAALFLAFAVAVILIAIRSCIL